MTLQAEIESLTQDRSEIESAKLRGAIESLRLALKIPDILLGEAKGHIKMED
jgi:hypothetical protein